MKLAAQRTLTVDADRKATMLARRLASRLVTPAIVLSAALLVIILANIGIGAVAVAPNQTLHVIGMELSDRARQVPGWSSLTAAWDGFVALPVVGGIAAAIDDATRPLQHWLTPAVAQRERAVVWSIRLPRALLGGIIGCGLAVSGAAMQGVFRNPLADPGLIGVSSGAALGAVSSIVLGIAWFGIWTLPIFAFAFGMAMTVVVYAVARNEGRTEVVTLLLAGIALNAIAGAATGLLISVASDQQIRSATFWTLGSLGGSRWFQVGIVGLVVLIGTVIVLRYANALNLFAIGEREARHLGIRIERVRVILIVTAAAMTGASVAFAGAIGFVGLVVPHLIRLWLGPDHRRLLPLSAAAGATLLLGADLVSRTIAQPTEIPIGVTMSLVGGPFFIWLLIHTRRELGNWA